MFSFFPSLNLSMHIMRIIYNLTFLFAKEIATCAFSYALKTSVANLSF